MKHTSKRGRSRARTLATFGIRIGLPAASTFVWLSWVSARVPPQSRKRARFVPGIERRYHASSVVATQEACHGSTGIPQDFRTGGGRSGGGAAAAKAGLGAG